MISAATTVIPAEFGMTPAETTAIPVEYRSIAAAATEAATTFAKISARRSAKRFATDSRKAPAAAVPIPTGDAAQIPVVAPAPVRAAVQIAATIGETKDPQAATPLQPETPASTSAAMAAAGNKKALCSATFFRSKKSASGFS